MAMISKLLVLKLNKVNVRCEFCDAVLDFVQTHIVNHFCLCIMLTGQFVILCKKKYGCFHHPEFLSFNDVSNVYFYFFIDVSEVWR